MLFVDIILPLSLPQMYTYSVPAELENDCHTGKRVVVQFGKKKLYSALVRNVHSNKPANYQTKDIITVLDNKPIVNTKQLELWDWIANYYLCNLGDVMKAALPSALKLESETIINYIEPTQEEPIHLTDKELVVVQYLQEKKNVSIEAIAALLDSKNALPVIKSLLDKGIASLEENITERFKPKIEQYIRLHTDIVSDDILRQHFNLLEKKAKKQLDVLMLFLSLSMEMQDTATRYSSKPVWEKYPEIKKEVLLANNNCTLAVLNGLIKKNILQIISHEKGRLDFSDKDVNAVKQLNEYQLTAYNEINQLFEEKDVVLLHGVTSSGKTEIYIHLIKEIIAQGKQVLYLLPEIALTSQIINRLRNIFGNQVGVYHSKFNDNERVEIWKSILAEGNKSYKIILGVRSSVFLPFSNLGLIIVDEEHENTYKQYDPAPRYHARDTAIMLARFHGAKTLLGTATPAIETYHNCITKKFGLVKIDQRYKDMELPEVLIANVKEAKRKKQMKSIFTPLLLDNIQLALENKEQVILFQNRRGFAPYMECDTCGWVPRCEHCDVSLTYHKYNNSLVCHYCGYHLDIMGDCLACGDTAMRTGGFGTEKIETEILEIFPQARVARMDLDTTRSRQSYTTIISGFENREVDILIGTQMISKGLDFDYVSVVGIMNADSLLNFPDFRAYERSFQMLAQVSGRAGRNNKRGKVIIQTSNPEHIVIQYVVQNNFRSMFNTELTQRKLFKYPPYTRIMAITLKHKYQDRLDRAAHLLAHNLRSSLGDAVLGPEYPLVGKIQNFYLKKILIKVEIDKSMSKVKEYIKSQINLVKGLHEYSTLVVNIDVDPM